MLGIIASNFLKKENGRAVVVKYATTVVYVGTPFFPQFLEKISQSHSNAWNNFISSKNTQQLIRKGIDDSTENMSGITDDHQNHEKCDCSDRCIKKNPKVKSKAKNF